jgi:hypothetical protein
MKNEIYIKSDTIPNHKYRVTLNNGEAIHCQCLGFLFYKRCKHLFRAEIRPTWDIVQATILRTMTYPEFLHRFNMLIDFYGGKTKNNKAVNNAICAFIKAYAHKS